MERIVDIIHTIRGDYEGVIKPLIELKEKEGWHFDESASTSFDFGIDLTEHQLVFTRK